MSPRLGILLNLPLVLVACGNADGGPSKDQASSTTPPVAEIHNGDTVSTCQWPSTVALLRPDGPFCTGTLIHPRFVVTAAHCVDGQLPYAMGFGEDGFAPQRTVNVVGCAINPLYFEELGVDMAICELATPVEDVQPVPIALGCELDALAPKAIVQIVGYGNEQSYLDEFGNIVDGEGLGPKRYTPQSVYEIREDAEEVDMFGVDEFSSACHGDSGGGAFLQLADGSWRLVGIAQSLFVPPEAEPGDETSTGGGTVGSTSNGSTAGTTASTDGTTAGTTGTTASTTGAEDTGGGFIVDPTNGADPQPICGPGTTYTLVAPQMAWLEDMMDLDGSPCFTAQGEWDPGEACTPFPMQLDQSVGSWEGGCAGELGGEPQCGELGPDPIGSTGEDPDTTSTGEDDPQPTSETGGSTTGESDPSTTTDTPPTPGSSTGEPLATASGTSDTSDTSDTADALGEDPGCGCQSDGNAGVLPMFAGLFFVGRRRRRRASRTA